MLVLDDVHRNRGGGSAAESREDEPMLDGLELFVAVVIARDGVRFTASAASRAELMEQVAEYVRCHADDQLWPVGASEVRALLDDGAPERAIERYFALVGERWDEAWLVVATVDARPARCRGLATSTRDQG